MRPLPPYVTPARAAAAAAAAVVLAAPAPAALGFYVTMVATTAMLGAAFTAYVAVVDEPGEWAVFDVAACSVAASLTLVGASVRFPAVLEATTPAIATRMAWLALAVAAAAALAPFAHQTGSDPFWCVRPRRGCGRG